MKPKRQPKPRPQRKPSPAPHPWLHPSLAALAAALAVSERTLELWRAKGAPLPDKPPFDELLLRLWHLAQPVTKRTADLAPAREVLATYADAAAQIRTAITEAQREADADPAALVKRRTAEKLQLANDRTRDLMRQRAHDCFLAMLGRLRQQLELRLGGQLAAQLWESAQHPRIHAEPNLRRQVIEAATLAVNESLVAAKVE